MGMKLEEITTETPLSLIATIKDKEVEVPLKMAELSENEAEEVRTRLNSSKFIALDVVVKEFEKKVAVISFQNSKADLILTAVKDEEIYKWDKASVDMMVLGNGRRIHIARVLSNNGEKFNRRKGVRIPLDKRMEIMQNGRTHSVIVRDLSYCGVGLVESGTTNIDPNEPFLLFLTEKKKDDDVLVGKFTCKVVRQLELPDDRGLLSGCIIAKEHYSFLQRYVATKQMQSIRGNEGYKDVQREEDDNDQWKEKIAKKLDGGY